MIRRVDRELGAPLVLRDSNCVSTVNLHSPAGCEALHRVVMSVCVPFPIHNSGSQAFRRTEEGDTRLTLVVTSTRIIKVGFRRQSDWTCRPSSLFNGGMHEEPWPRSVKQPLTLELYKVKMAYILTATQFVDKDVLL